MSPPTYEPLLVTLQGEDEWEEDISPRFEQVLKEIFLRFDKDNDGELSLEEVQDFAKETNGSEVMFYVFSLQRRRLCPI